MGSKKKSPLPERFRHGALGIPGTIVRLCGYLSQRAARYHNRWPDFKQQFSAALFFWRPARQGFERGYDAIQFLDDRGSSRRRKRRHRGAVMPQRSRLAVAKAIPERLAHRAKILHERTRVVQLVGRRDQMYRGAGLRQMGQLLFFPLSPGKEKGHQ